MYFWNAMLHLRSINQKQPREVLCKKGALKNFAKMAVSDYCTYLQFP